MRRLALIAIFRNEEHILEEFIEHHIAFGVDKFYLIDNSSSDNSKQVISKYIDSGLVKYYFEPTVFNEKKLETKNSTVKLEDMRAAPQVYSYNRVLPDVEEEYAIICDCDEFWYFQDLSWNLNKLFDYMEDTNTTQVLMPLKNYISGGVEKQPKSVRETFIYRNLATKHPYVPAIHKSIFKVSECMEANITACNMKSGLTRCGGLKRASDWFVKNKYFHTFYLSGKPVRHGIKRYRDVDDSFYTEAIICGNHYMLQSREWFFTVKAKRGICTIPARGNKETLEQFWQRRWDTLENQTSIEDTFLKDLIKEK